jgi:hypothetical protein
VALQQQINQGILKHELFTFLPLGKVLTSYVENELEDTDSNNNGFIQCTGNGYWM